MTATAYLHAVGTAVPDTDIHRCFIDWAARRIADDRERALFARMAERSGIDHRWSVLRAPVGEGGFYSASWPSTARRMDVYGEAAPDLAARAVRALGERTPIERITHLVVASCTGFTAPGTDQRLAALLGLPATVERLLVGYMGCYAAVVALRSARHIVRSEPGARVLVVCVELSTLHLQDSGAVEPLLAMLQFGDGAAAALVTGEPGPITLDRPFSTTLPESADLIRWDLGDHGFAMHLSGAVPGAIGAALADPAMLPEPAADMDLWAVHAGGRSILDAVARALALPPDALDHSRAILRAFGNMSSATLLFVLARILAGDARGRGMALAFGPGMAMEGLTFRREDR
ncbi:MAG: type III polyketide synthase [Sphingobium sp.]|nr:type III polyketide synthase [Sphingobium sp.]